MDFLFEDGAYPDDIVLDTDEVTTLACIRNSAHDFDQTSAGKYSSWGPPNSSIAATMRLYKFIDPDIPNGDITGDIDCQASSTQAMFAKVTPDSFGRFHANYYHHSRYERSMPHNDPVCD